MKENYKDMLLVSESGYMMPFALGEKESLPIALPYGKQRHPRTNEEFFHQGVDFSVKGKDLYAMASGMVVGAGNDALHDNYIVAKYGKYEVTYGHLEDAYCGYGTSVAAGDKIAKSGDFLHVGVRFDGRDIDPMDFLSMVWANVQQLAAMGINKQPTMETLGGKAVRNSYEKDKDAILMLMLRWLPSYMNSLRDGSYVSPRRAEESLRNIFSQAASRNYFFESMPSVSNPLGLSDRSVPLAEKVQDILIGDFLSFLALNHNIYPATWGEDEKKNFFHRRQPTDSRQTP